MEILKVRISSSNIISAIAFGKRADVYMIDEKICIMSSTWSFLKGMIDGQDRQKFEVIYISEYGLRREDMVFSKEAWRGEE